MRHKAENVRYIAKKVMLSGLKQKEKEAAMLEVNLLKNLDHQHMLSMVSTSSGRRDDFGGRLLQFFSRC